MAAVTIAATSISMYLLYNTSFEEQRTRLVELVQSQARTFETISRIENEHIEHGHTEVSRSDIVEQVRTAHNEHQEFGTGVELVLVERVGDEIVFRVSHRESVHGENLAPIPYDSVNGEAVRRAVDGQSGSVIASDYRGVDVLAAYEPVAGTGLGLVAKIDISAIQFPFIKAGMASGAVAAVLILIGAFLFWRINNAGIRILEQTLMERDAANRSKTEFLANMSHELRTPLTAIIGYAEVMCDETFGPIEVQKYREYVESIRASGEHLHALINDILDVSAIEAGRMNLSDEQFDLPEVVEAAARIVLPRATEKGVSIKTSVDPCIKSMIGDERRIKQILVNLLSNATKFTDEGGRVILSAHANDNGSFAIDVVDTGIGMTEDQISIALMKFGQVKNAQFADQEGTGLGLPLVKGLVEAHQGKLIIQSRYGQGTTVTVLFPGDRRVA